MEHGVDPWIREMFVFRKTPETMRALREALSEIVKEVRLWLFTSISECWTCSDTEELVSAIEEAAPPGKVKVFKLIREKDEDVFKFMNVDRVPTIVTGDGAIRYIGMPAGEEIKGFVETIVRIGTNNLGLSKSTVDRIAEIEEKVVIDVVVTPPCPYCPYAAFLANMFAYASKLYGKGVIVSRVIEAFENPDIADYYGVTTVPVVAINGRVVFVGPPTEEQLLIALLREVG